MIERLCIIGVGLIGGSLARALRRAGYCQEIVGAGRSQANLERALELGVIDRFETDLLKAVSGTDMIVLAVPLGAMERTLAEIAPGFSDKAVLTDVGSAKVCVVEAARRVFGKVPAGLVPGHPIAGTEQSGVEASFAELFEHRRVILTPEMESDEQATAKVRNMWEAAGAQVVEMEAAHHDAVLAATSHLPHILAYTLVESLVNMGDREEMFAYAAGGFRDFSRIASSDPVMWRDICLANSEAIVAMIDRFRVDLDGIGAAIKEHDADRLLGIFQRAKQARDNYVDKLVVGAGKVAGDDE